MYSIAFSIQRSAMEHTAEDTECKHQGVAVMHVMCIGSLQCHSS